MKAIYILLASSVLFGCATKQEQRYNDIMYTKWKNEILEGCEEQSANLTLRLYEARTEEWTESDTREVNKFLLDGCVKHNGISI